MTTRSERLLALLVEEVVKNRDSIDADTESRTLRLVVQLNASGWPAVAHLERSTRDARAEHRRPALASNAVSRG